MTAHYEGLQVLASGHGRCQTCRQDVHRVLVEARSGYRLWHTVDLGSVGFTPHECPGAPPPRDPAPLRKAA